MPHTLTIALAQLNPTVGDIPGNLARIRRARDEAATRHADLVLTPELSLVGYPPEDLVLRPACVEAAAAALGALADESRRGGPGVVVGLPFREGGHLRNAAALVCDGRTQLTFKHELPNYGVFDEKRVFSAGPLPETLDFRGLRLGVPICEDIWCDPVARHLGARGARILLVPNGSPFEVGKFDQRLALARRRAAEVGCALVYVNQVGGQDELVFDGGSFAVDADGSLTHLLPRWGEAVAHASWTADAHGLFHSEARVSWTEDTPERAIYGALVLGLRDYVEKNGFRGVVLGLSGGIDSALTAAVAVDALGPARTRGVRLPSRYTSAASQDDALDSATLLGLRLDTMPIVEPVAALSSALASTLADHPRGTTDENLQSRTRGVMLMALSNAFGELLLTTGNKSEVSVGYATLYGDMCGGYSVLKDVYKGEVYGLARWRNAHRPDGALGPGGRVIPESSITKAPTAELRPNQTDQDSLPPYDVLDGILRGLIEDEASVNDLVGRGFARETAIRVQQMLFAAEFKRRQAAPGVKITRKGFGRDRRYPMTNRFREI